MGGSMRFNQKKQLPPFSTLLKSRDVEDPVNRWFNRPFAYLIVIGLYRTPITPNQITFISLILGLAASVCWFLGTPGLMLWGGILLWASAIFDGADGILARAKNIQSDFGRALDGSIDLIVGGATVMAAVYHLWVKHHNPVHLVLAVVAVTTTILQIYLYDYYRESYMSQTNPSWNGIFEQLSDVDARMDQLNEQKGSWVLRFTTHLYRGLVLAQTRIIKKTNPYGRRQNLRFKVSDASATIYRRYNRIPIRLWTWISLAPHCYLMAIGGMVDRLDLYLWLRAVLANLIFIVVLVWQRQASKKTITELKKNDLDPIPF
jgi:phosphatidylglycerophosphate synthase